MAGDTDTNACITGKKITFKIRELKKIKIIYLLKNFGENTIFYFILPFSIKVHLLELTLESEIYQNNILTKY